MLILIFLSYCLFYRDLMIEKFDGQCLNLNSRGKLGRKGFAIMHSASPRTKQDCPTPLCRFDEEKDECVAKTEYAQDATIQHYCKTEKFVEKAPSEDMCRKMGFQWNAETNKCTPSILRDQFNCPTDINQPGFFNNGKPSLCSWDVANNVCKANKSNVAGYDYNDFNSVEDYCRHMINLDPNVSKLTCDVASNINDQNIDVVNNNSNPTPRARETYDWNHLNQKCLNVNVNPRNVYDQCWGSTDSMDECADRTHRNSKCLWMPYIPKITNEADIKGLRVSEIEMLEKEANHLNHKLDNYLDKSIQYQEKQDTEQAARLILKTIHHDQKTRYHFEEGVQQFDQDYENMRYKHDDNIIELASY